MDVTKFWELNEGLKPDSAAEELRGRLSELEPDEIASYQEHSHRADASAFQWPLWAAAYIIDGGCSDDGFMDFRYGLIALGQSVFESALADSESLVSVADTVFIPNEEFGYVAGQVI